MNETYRSFPPIVWTMVNHSSIFYIIFGHQYRRNLVMVKNYQKKVRRISKIKAQLLKYDFHLFYRYSRYNQIQEIHDKVEFKIKNLPVGTIHWKPVIF